jgi:hypothetical protein
MNRSVCDDVTTEATRTTTTTPIEDTKTMPNGRTPLEIVIIIITIVSLIFSRINNG